jgi:outer membrane lipoprotein-sorting protein
MMRIGWFLWCLLMTVPFLAACSSSGQAQMTPEKFKDMVAMLLKLDELKKKEVITEAEFQLQKKRLLGEEKQAEGK